MEPLASAIPDLRSAAGLARVIGAFGCAAKNAEILGAAPPCGAPAHHRASPLSWSDRAVISALARLVRVKRRRLALIVSPRTVLRWHARLVARQWTVPQRRPGRPRTAPAIRSLVVAMARDNRHGVTGASRVNCSDSVTGSPPALCGRCCRKPGSIRARSGPGPRGYSSSPPRPTASSQWISSTSTRCSTAVSTCCSSWSTTPAE